MGSEETWASTARSWHLALELPVLIPSLGSPYHREKDVQVTNPASSALARWTCRVRLSEALTLTRWPRKQVDGCSVAWLTGGFRARRRWA
jgi:hypothetical protein